MSGKEAEVYLVQSGADLGVAKVYKNANNRSFKHRSQYTEGRGMRRSRDSRAVAKGSRYGRQMAEEAWKNAEADVIYRLRDAGVRVPEPYHYHEGILVMELVTDADGDPAHRLGDVELEPAMAELFFEILIREVVRMTAAGVVHGDLSEFNILVGADGPVIIDFPQAVDAASNPHAQNLLLRDVNNLVRFVSRYNPTYKGRPYGQELWDIYKRAELTPETPLTGRWRPQQRGTVQTDAVLNDIRDARNERRGHSGPTAARGRPLSNRHRVQNKEPGSPAVSTQDSATVAGHARRVYEPQPKPRRTSRKPEGQRSLADNRSPRQPQQAPRGRRHSQKRQ